MFGLRGWEWVIILLIALLIFGPSKLPQLGSAIGKTVRELRKNLGGEGEEGTEAKEEPEKAEEKEEA